MSSRTTGGAAGTEVGQAPREAALPGGILGDEREESGCKAAVEATATSAAASSASGKDKWAEGSADVAGKARETAADTLEEISGWVGGCSSRSELLIRLSECEGEPEVPSIQRKEAKSRRSSSSLDNYLQRQLINVVFVGGCRKDLLGSAFIRAFYAREARHSRAFAYLRARPRERHNPRDGECLEMVGPKFHPKSR